MAAIGTTVPRAALVMVAVGDLTASGGAERQFSDVFEYFRRAGIHDVTLITARAALTNFRLADPLRGRGLGRFLLDTALHAMATQPEPAGGYAEVELYTHLVHNTRAVALYEARGFVVDDFWVSLAKT